jgi:hypothetical protein
MQSARHQELFFPIFSQPQPPKTQLLRDDLVGWIRSNGGGWASVELMVKENNLSSLSLKQFGM